MRRDQALGTLQDGVQVLDDVPILSILLNSSIQDELVEKAEEDQVREQVAREY